MSRIGNQPIVIPSAVKVAIKDRVVAVEGPKGKLDWEIPTCTSAKLEDNVLTISRDGNDRETRAFHGLARALVNNMVVGVNEGFVKRLEIQGVGFKADVSGQKINLNVGYSHPVVYEAPASVKVTIKDATKITIEGPNKQLVGKVAAELRAYYPAEPYKGKGIRYEGEVVVRKEGKTVQ